MKVVGYARGSTEGQTITIEKQRRAIEKYCEEQGYELEEIGTNNVSGRSSIISYSSGNSGEIDLTNRPVLQSTLEIASSDDIDKVIVYNPSRLARISHYQGMLEEVFEEAGAPIEYVEASEVWILRKIQSIWDEYEVRQTVKRTKEALQERKEQNKWNGRPPVGYRVIQEEDEGPTGKLERVKPIWDWLKKAENIYESDEDIGYKSACEEAIEQAERAYQEAEEYSIKPHQVRSFINRDKEKIKRCLKDSEGYGKHD